MESFKEICDFCPLEEVKKCTGGRIANEFKSLIKNSHSDKFVISLSGGVDSMITSWIMKQICKKAELLCVHINYNNRETSIVEADFVKTWCNLMDIPYSIVNIYNLKRVKQNGKIVCYENDLEISRNIYEEKTKKIRFDEYTRHKCPVILGHNHDDLLENIITNISNNRTDKLGGMERSSVINGVNIVRPMISITKKEIYEYAIKTNVPYLEDSTPAWSRRGKLRDTFVPAVSEIEPNFMKGLQTLIEYHNII